MIGKYDIKKGDKVKYTCYSFGGEPIVVDNITVRDVSDGEYPIIDLSNGHEAQWDGATYTISDLNYVELVNATQRPLYGVVWNVMEYALYILLCVVRVINNKNLLK